MTSKHSSTTSTPFWAAANKKMIDSLSDIPEVAAYLRRIKAEARGLLTAVIAEKRGKYWRDIAYIKLDRKEGVIRCSDEAYAPNENEVALIKAAVMGTKFPEPMITKNPLGMPKLLTETHPDNLFEFRDHEGNLIMIQQRLDPKEDHEEKRYIPWTYWSDGKWRAAEPDGMLPLYGLETIGYNTTVFIHEGAKAARAARRIVENNTPHPWLEDLKMGAHIGWSGGALNPQRTDWKILTELGIKRAYIVSDNDKPGRESVAPISKQLRFQTYHLQFTEQWPPAFDLADPFPDEMFKEIDGVSFYRGPSFDACVHPATWMTDRIKVPKARDIIMLRPHAKEEWFYIPEADIYVNLDKPFAGGGVEKVVNNVLSAFSDASNTCGLINSSYSGRLSKLCYRPDIEARKVISDGTSAVNMHVPSNVRPIAGDPTPFLEFMEYLLPRKEERDHVLRWCATLIARPWVRMPWAILLISETQGIGKSTLCSHILAPLVGPMNVSFPTEDDIVESQFNSWLANKRLVVVNEIYSGHSWKAYNRLKNYVTETEIQVNEKNQKRYKTDCWTHFVACSNSPKAMKVEDKDRRWMIPEVAEVPWKESKFVALRNWLTSGGLSIIKHWAEGYGSYVTNSERAPRTDKKDEMVRSSLSLEEAKCASLAERIVANEEQVAIGTHDLEAWARQESKGKSFATGHDLRKALNSEGMKTLPKRIRLNGNLQYISISPVLYASNRELFNGDGAGVSEYIKSFVKHPSELVNV